MPHSDVAGAGSPAVVPPRVTLVVLGEVKSTRQSGDKSKKYRTSNIYLRRVVRESPRNCCTLY